MSTSYAQSQNFRDIEAVNKLRYNFFKLIILFALLCSLEVHTAVVMQRHRHCPMLLCRGIEGLKRSHERTSCEELFSGKNGYWK